MTITALSCQAASLPGSMPTFTLSPWAWALILSAAVLALAVLAQGKLLFGRTWRIRRTDQIGRAHV